MHKFVDVVFYGVFVKDASLHRPRAEESDAVLSRTHKILESVADVFVNTAIYIFFPFFWELWREVVAIRM